MQRRIPVVGLHGLIGSGKSTAAEILQQKRNAVEMEFADPLKESIMALLGFTRDQVYGTQEQKATVDDRHGISPREAMQKFGIMARNIFGPTVFTRRVRQKIDTAADAGCEMVVMTGVRFPEEAQLIHDLGGIVVSLKRGKQPTPEELATMHASETSLDMDHVDVTIDNNGTLQDLEEALLDALV